MTRFLLTTALCAALPLSAQADDFLIRADLARATIFGSGADVARMGTALVPAGRHRLLIAMPDLNAAELPQITGTAGVRFGPPQALASYPVAEGSLDDAAQAAARAEVERAFDALQEAQDALTQADVALRAIETQQGYITAILNGGDAGVSMPEDPAMVVEFLSTLGAQTARLAEEMAQARIARRDFVEGVTEAQRAHTEATDALRRLQPFGANVGVIAVDVTVEDETEVDVDLSYFTRNAAWRPSYELDLDTDSGLLEVERFVTLETYGAARWQDVDVTFSTAAPVRDREPSILSSRPARLSDPLPIESPAGRAMEAGVVSTLIAQDAAGYASPAPVVMVEAVPVPAQFDGLAVSYPYPAPVSVAASGRVQLPFDTLELEVETENRAVPRWDETAFLIAMMTNDTGEPILPGTARFYRDGALIGEGGLPLIPAGAEAEMAFGSLDHLQLAWIDRSLAEGDSGIFGTSNTQARALAFGVENTSDTEEAVRILYALPFAEQEDLELDLTLSQSPSEEDIDGQRGVSAWDLSVASGAEEMIELSVEFEFPEGQILDWRP